MLRRYLNECDNAKYSALTFSGGNAFRKDISTWSINSPIVGDERVDLNALLNSMNDAALHEVMTDLGGHCFETVLNAFEQASQSDRRTAFLMYTIKGYGLPLAGHRDNHGLFLQNKQVDSFQESLGIPKGKEWDKMAGVKDVENVTRLLKESPINVPSSRKYVMFERKAREFQSCHSFPTVLCCHKYSNKPTHSYNYHHSEHLLISLKRKIKGLEY